MSVSNDTFVCSSCIGEAWIKNELFVQAAGRVCDYCSSTLATGSVEVLVPRVGQVLKEHFYRSDISRDEFHEDVGKPAREIISDILQAKDVVVDDVLNRLCRGGFRVEEGWGESVPITEKSNFAVSFASSQAHEKEWGNFRRSLKENCRFFNKDALDYLSSIFLNLAALSIGKEDVSVFVGPSHEIKELYRAREFQSHDALCNALFEIDSAMGAPPGRVASAGRMNAHGISVFYGALRSDVAISEVRPSVGSKVVVGRFKLLRNLSLLNLGAFCHMEAKGSFFDPDFIRRKEKIAFLSKLREHVSRPVGPNDHLLEYVPTQVVADFLASFTDWDGIIFDSVQSDELSGNVVLFNKAARSRPNLSTFEQVRPLVISLGSFIPPSIYIHDRSPKKGVWKPVDNRAETLELELYDLSIHEIKSTLLKTTPGKITVEDWQEVF
ncbi:MAG: RES domain-containing protein [Verrucomicrobiaceae bacterium]|nr:MAG: RES domain-containing protein [Verrucomicrobiaceae bacterium]